MVVISAADIDFFRKIRLILDNPSYNEYSNAMSDTELEYLAIESF